MRILVVSQYFYPETFRINDIVRELVKRGHAVTVVTGRPNYPKGEIYEGYEESYKSVENYCGATIHRCKLRARKKGVFNLALNYLSFIHQANKTLKRIEPNFDVIFFYGLSPVFSGLPAIKYGKKHRIRTVAYNLDIWPDSVRDSCDGRVMSKSNPIYLISKMVSKYIYCRFDKLLNKCDDFGVYLHDLFKLPFDKMHTLYEHAEDIYLSVDEDPFDNGLIDFVFLGNIGKSQNCDQIVLAFNAINNEKARLHFVGDGSYLEDLKKLVHRLDLDERVFFYGKKTIEEVIPFYNMADVCVLSLSNKTASGLTPPGKLFSYMASGRMIVASINGSSRDIINEAQCGLSCPADDVQGLSTLMERVTRSFDSYSTCGKNGRLFFVHHFTLKQHIDALEKHLVE